MLNYRAWEAHQLRPGADQGELVGDGSARDLLQRLNHIIHINMTQQYAQGEAAL